MESLNFKSYNDLVVFLGKRQSRKMGNNTYLEKGFDLNDTIGLRYHNTHVVKFFKTHMQLFTGGWYTVTTKERINLALSEVGQYLSQDKSIWYLNDKIPFSDGMRIDYDGNVFPEDIKVRESDKRTKMIKLINTYVKGFSYDKCGEQGGDCFYCQMSEVKTGKGLGDINKDTDHLLGHLKEKYYMISLVYRAFQHSGMSEAGISWLMYSKDNDRAKQMMRRYFKDMLLDRTGA